MRPWSQKIGVDVAENETLKRLKNVYSKGPRWLQGRGGGETPWKARERPATGAGASR